MAACFAVATSCVVAAVRPGDDQVARALDGQGMAVCVNAAVDGQRHALFDRQRDVVSNFNATI